MWVPTYMRGRAIVPQPWVRESKQTFWSEYLAERLLMKRRYRFGSSCLRSTWQGTDIRVPADAEDLPQAVYNGAFYLAHHLDIVVVLQRRISRPLG